MKNKASINREAIVEALELPKDLMLGRTILTASGNRELTVENHRGISDYREDQVVILSKEFRILVAGSGISIAYYNRDSIKLTGDLERIEFLYDS